MKKLTIKLTVVVFTLAACVTLASCRFLAQRSTEAQPSVPIIDPEIKPEWIFITNDIRWQLPPKEIVKEMGLFYDGDGSLMILYPSGELAVVNCDFRKDGETGQTSLNGVVSFSVDKGKWWRNADGTVTTVSRFCVSPMGLDRSNDPPIERQWKIAGQSPNRVAGLLVSRNESAVPLPDDFRDIDGIRYMLGFGVGCK
jgi:hypothetical protein